MSNVKLIAETAWHHNGDYSFMYDLIQKIITKSKSDIIKMHITIDFDEYMDVTHSIYYQLKEKLFSNSQWNELIIEVLNNKKELMLLYNDVKAIEFGAAYHPKYVEVHSVCLNDYNLLDAVKNNIDEETNIVLGIGGSTIEEIEMAINRLQHDKVILMYGFQNYPTIYSDINFKKLQNIMQLYPQYNFGYADHTAWNEPNNILITLLGFLQGVSYIEKHITTTYGEERTDWNSAISIEMFNEIANKIKVLDKCNGSGTMDLNEGEKAYSVFGPMKKAAILKVDVKDGEIHKLENIIFKRIEQKSDMSQVEIIQRVGSRYSNNLPAGTLLYKKDFI